MKDFGRQARTCTDALRRCRRRSGYPTGIRERKRYENTLLPQNLLLGNDRKITKTPWRWSTLDENLWCQEEDDVAVRP